MVVDLERVVALVSREADHRRIVLESSRGMNIANACIAKPLGRVLPAWGVRSRREGAVAERTLSEAGRPNQSREQIERVIHTATYPL